jgi:hypothetical protein
MYIEIFYYLFTIYSDTIHCLGFPLIWSISKIIQQKVPIQDGILKTTKELLKKYLIY